MEKKSGKRQRGRMREGGRENEETEKKKRGRIL